MKAVDYDGGDEHKSGRLVLSNRLIKGVRFIFIFFEWRKGRMEI